MANLDEAMDAFDAVAERSATLQPSRNNSDAHAISMYRMKLVTEEDCPLLPIGHLYGTLIHDYLSSLKEDVPGRVRLRREQLVRSVAAYLCFASHSIVAPPHDVDPAPTVDSDPVDDQQLQPVSSQTSVTGQASLDADNLADARSRLSATPPSTQQQQVKLSSSAARILAHWDLSSKRADYDWLATHTRLTAQAAEKEQMSGLTDEGKRALTKKQARQEQRRKREEARLASQQFSQSQAPSILLSSQAVPWIDSSQDVESRPRKRARSEGFAAARQDDGGLGLAPSSQLHSSQLFSQESMHSDGRSGSMRGRSEPAQDALADPRPHHSQGRSIGMLSPQVTSQAVPDTQNFGAASQSQSGGTSRVTIPVRRKAKRRNEGF